MFQLKVSSPNRSWSLCAFVACGTALSAAAHAQIGATLRYEVALPGGEWGSSVSINPGDRVEWRAVVNFTGTQAAQAVGRVIYQPVLSNADNAGPSIDDIGAFRAGADPILSQSEGQSTLSLASYGRVSYGVSLSHLFLGHRHSAGSNGAPAGEYIRIARDTETQWYPPNGSGSTLGSVFSDNNSAISTRFVAGTQNMTIFRQAFIASSDVPTQMRTLSLFSEAGGTPTLDGFPTMTWALAGEGGSTATVRTNLEFIPATINIVPAPGVLAFASLGGFCALRRRRS